MFFFWDILPISFYIINHYPAWIIHESSLTRCEAQHMKFITNDRKESGQIKEY